MLSAVSSTSEREAFRYQLIPSPLVCYQPGSGFFVVLSTISLHRGINISVGRPLAYVNSMVEKETVGVRLPQDKVNEIEEMAEENDISKSDATRRLIREGMKLQDSGITVAAGNSLLDPDETAKAESPLNSTDPYTLTTLVLVLMISLKVFGIL